MSDKARYLDHVQWCQRRAATHIFSPVGAAAWLDLSLEWLRLAREDPELLSKRRQELQARENPNVASGPYAGANRS